MASSKCKTVAVIVSSGFGTGYARVMPGTVGTVAALVVWYLLKSIGVWTDRWGDLCVALGVTTLGTFSVLSALRENDQKDPQWIVIDEWAGISVALIGVPVTAAYGMLAAFLTFRALDMVKPGPVGWVERLPGAYGIMADDLVAGVLAWCVVRLFI